MIVAYAARQQAMVESVYKARVQKRAKLMSLALNYAAGRAFFRWKKVARAKRRQRCTALIRLWFRRMWRERLRIRQRRAADLVRKFLVDIASSDIISRSIRKLVGTVARVKLWWVRRYV